MKIRKLGFVTCVLLALGLASAGNAPAAATTTTAEWYSGTTAGGVTTLAGTGTETAAIASSSGIGSLALVKSAVSGVALEITATGLSCVSCTITNGNTTKPNVATGKYKLEFTGATVMTPSTCEVTGGKFRTGELFVEAHYMEGIKSLQKFAPVTGEPFATFTLQDAGLMHCQIPGTYKITGSAFSESANNTNVFATEQQTSFSPAITALAGGGLALGTEAAQLTVSGKFRLGGNFFGLK